MKSWRNYIKEITIIVGVVLLVIVMMDYNTRLEKLNQLNEKAFAARAEATALFETQIILQTQIAEATSDPVTEGEARNSGEIQAGDQRIVPIPAVGETTAPGKMVPGAMVQGAGGTGRSGLARQNALRLRDRYSRD